MTVPATTELYAVMLNVLGRRWKTDSFKAYMFSYRLLSDSLVCGYVDEGAFAEYALNNYMARLTSSISIRQPHSMFQPTLDIATPVFFARHHFEGLLDLSDDDIGTIYKRINLADVW